jgi:hypothetical protein
MDADLPTRVAALTGGDRAVERIFRAICDGSRPVVDPRFGRRYAIPLAQWVLALLDDALSRGAHGADLSNVMVKGCS